MANTRSLLRNELRDYRDRAATVLSGLRRDLTDKAEALQAIVEAMASADGDHEERLQKSLLQLRKLAASPAAAPVKTAIVEASGQIEASIEEIKRLNGLTISQFMVEIKTLHKRIDSLETAGRKDVLTGLATRTEMERLISAEVDGRKGFSLLLLRICNLPMIQRQFGLGIRTDVISAFAKRLHGGLPPESQCRPLERGPVYGHAGGGEIASHEPGQAADATCIGHLRLHGKRQAAAAGSGGECLGHRPHGRRGLRIVNCAYQPVVGIKQIVDAVYLLTNDDHVLLCELGAFYEESDRPQQVQNSRKGAKLAKENNHSVLREIFVPVRIPATPRQDERRCQAAWHLL